MKSELVNAVDRLLESQAIVWPMLTRGLQGLRDSRMRVEPVFGRDFLVRHIPHRIKSTTAAVDSESVARRACFLCPANLDPEEQGIPFGPEYMIYCNPFPILERHLTIVHVGHRPQRLSGQIRAMLDLAHELPDSFLIYNGPACGASAPDHLHFQACSRNVFPIERHLIDGGGILPSGYVPRAFAISGSELAGVTRRAEGLLGLLDEVAGSDSGEPMINVTAFFSDGRWSVVVFPRGKHRPRVYETKELTVSPATIDLCGVFVVPVPGDFEKIRGVDIEGILEEVTLPADLFNVVASRMKKEL